MKKILLSLVALTLAFAARADKVWQQVTEIVAGDVVVMAVDNGTVTKELTGITGTSTKFGEATDFEGTPAGTYALTVVEGNAEGSVAFQTVDGTYLSWSSGNSLTAAEELNDASSWTLEVADERFVVTNVGTTARILQYNAGSPRFACYTSNQTKLVFYKEVEVEGVVVAKPTLPASASFIGSTTIEITAAEGTTIYYTLDGSDPKESGTAIEYTEAFELTETTTVKAFAMDEEANFSDVATATYTALEKSTIAEAQAAEAGTTVVVEGTVVASAANGAVLYDGTDYLYYYNTSNALAVGQQVRLIGALSTYGGANQLSNTAAITVLSEDNEVTHPEATELDGAAFDEIKANGIEARQYVSFVGTLAISGNYYNITIDGAETAVGSIVKPNEDLSELNGKEVVVKGYLMYVNSKYVYAVATSVEEYVAPVEPVTFAVVVAETENGTVAADVEEAEEGTLVALTITPAEGYEIDEVAVTTEDGAVEVAEDYTFTLPAAAVLVTVTFKEVAVEPEPEPEPEPAGVATLVHTASSSWSSNKDKNTVDSEAEYYNNEVGNGWGGAAFAEFALNIPKGATITSATLTWTTVTGGRVDTNRDNKVYYLNVGETVDYEAIAAEADPDVADNTRLYANAKTYIDNYQGQNTFTGELDVTAAIQAIAEAGQNYIVFQWTGNNAGATLAGKASENAPVLNIEYIPGAPELANPAFDANAENIITVTTQGYERNIAAGSDQITGLQPVEGWTAGTQTASDPGFTGGVFAYGSENLLNNKVAAPAAGPEGETDGVALGLSALWSGVAQYTQDVTLTAGDYKLTYVVYNGANTGDVTKNLFGFIAKDGTEYLSTQKSFAVGEWQTIEVPFTVAEETTGRVSVGFIGSGGSGTAPHLFVDHVELAKVLGVEVALNDLAKAIENAQAKADSYTVGEGMFQYPASEVETLTVAIATAQAAYDAAESKEAVEAATATLNEVAPAQTLPDAEKVYSFQLKLDGETPLYMHLSESGITIEETATAIKFVATDVAGHYNLVSYNDEYTVGLTREYAWTMSTSASQKEAWTFTALADGSIRINNLVTAGRFVGTNANDKTAGKPCYADKLTTTGNVDWIIVETEAPQPAPTFAVVVAETENGTVAADVEEAEEGATVTLTVEAAEGYELELLAVTYVVPAEEDGAEPEVVAVELTEENTFVMPAADVTVTATFAEIPAPTFAVVVAETENGTVTADVEEAEEGATVTLTVEAAEGYELESLAVTYVVPAEEDGAEPEVVAVELTEENTFVMPAADVTVTAVFAEIPVVEPLELTLDVERYPGMGYGVTEATVDFAEALEFLGVETLTTDMLRIVNPDGTEISNYGTYDGWFNAEGVATTWGDNTKINVKFFEAIPAGAYTICDMNGADEVGTTYTVKWALEANDKKVVYTINVTFVEKPAVELTFDALEVKDNVSVELTSELGKSYEGLSADVDVEAILTTLDVESLDDVDIYAVLSDGSLDDMYKLGTTDGWRNADGDWQSWGDAAYFFVKADFARESGQIYEAGGMDGKNTTAEWENPAVYTATYAFVKKGTAETVVLTVTLTYNVPTGIRGIAFGTAVEGAYDLTGRKVDTLVKGRMYIVNGKKVMVK